MWMEATETLTTSHEPWTRIQLNACPMRVCWIENYISIDFFFFGISMSLFSIDQA